MLVRLTAGEARQQAALLQTTMQKELDATNTIPLAAHGLEVVAYQASMEEFNSLSEADRAGKPRPVPPQDPVLATDIIHPVTRFWQLMEQLYPERIKCQDIRI